jgi:hypothetical protein
MTVNAQQYTMWKIPFQEANGHSAIQEFLRHLQSPKFHFCVYTFSQLGPDLNLDLSHTKSFLLCIHLDIFLHPDNGSSWLQFFRLTIFKHLSPMSNMTSSFFFLLS